VTAEGRKISGNGAAEIGDYTVLVGNLIADFDYETMVRVLRVPDAKLRDKVFKSLRQNLTTLQRELGQAPEWQELVWALVPNFEVALGPLTRAALPQAVYERAADLAETYTTEDWLLKPGQRFRDGRRVRIVEGVEVVQRLHKAPGGLIRAVVEVREGKIESVGFSGDFFFYPAHELAALEHSLTGLALSEARRAIADFYREYHIDSPGVTPRDLAVAIGAADAYPGRR